MIEQLLNWVIAKYRDFSVRLSQCLTDQLFDQLATDKSQFFAQPRPTIVNCSVISQMYMYITLH